MSTKRGLDNALVGAAGVHYVAAMLSLRGLIALATIRNAPGIDLVVVNPDGSWHANVQVKTSQYKVSFWPLGNKYHKFSGPHNYYAFLRYLTKDSQFEIFLETADRVIQDADRATAESKKKDLKEWAPCWALPRDAEGIRRVQEQWKRFSPEAG